MQDLRRYDIFEVGLAVAALLADDSAHPGHRHALSSWRFDRRFPGEIKGYGMPRFLELVNITGGFSDAGGSRSDAVERDHARVRDERRHRRPGSEIGGSIGSTVRARSAADLRPLRVLIRLRLGCRHRRELRQSDRRRNVRAGDRARQKFEAKHFYLIIPPPASAVAAAQFSVEHVPVHPISRSRWGARCSCILLGGSLGACGSSSSAF
jgi:hypothetical protein